MNMSYCRFQNTRGDVRECLNALSEREKLSADEHYAAQGMLMSIISFLQEEGIIDTVNNEPLNGIINECKENELETL